MNRRRTFPGALSAAAALALAILPRSLGACDWPQFDLDPQHSGNNTREVFLSAANVSNLAPLYQVALRGTADGAPVFLTRVPTAGGVKDLLFVTTTNGYIQALDAHTGVEVWSHQPATGPNYTTSSPAIDPSRLYVYSYGLEGAVHKYQVGDGTEITTGGWPQTATLKPDVEKGSSALGVATAAGGTSYLYCTNGGYPGDAGDYQGHVTAVNLADGAQSVFNAACSDMTIHFIENGTPGTNDCAQVQNAIWARPGAVYDAATNRVYMATGNGGYDGVSNWSETVFCLNPDGTGTGGRPLDTYTPTNYQSLDNSDLDLGSTSPVLLPMPAGSSFPHVAAQCGKDAMIRLINLDDMSGQGGPGFVGGEMQLIPVPQGGEVLPTPAVWVNPADGSTWVFVASYNGISGLQVTLTAGTPQLAPRWNIGSGSVSSPIVANNVLYYFDGSVHAANPATGAAEINPPISVGPLHWESPIVANGILYIPDDSGNLTAYTVQGGFADVPASNPLHVQVDSLARNGVSAGCGGGNFCPANSVLRSQMAVFLLRGEHGSCYEPPPATGIFADVPASNAFAPWIEQIYHESITGGCSTSPLDYCPGNAVIRASMAVFLLRAEHGPTYTPPACAGIFADVACPGPFTNWIEQLYNEGITSGCSTNPLKYCPGNSVTRVQMAVFLVTTFQLP